jgi:hypothetical protein
MKARVKLRRTLFTIIIVLESRFIWTRKGRLALDYNHFKISEPHSTGNDEGYFDVSIPARHQPTCELTDVVDPKWSRETKETLKLLSKMSKPVDRGYMIHLYLTFANNKQERWIVDTLEDMKKVRHPSYFAYMHTKKESPVIIFGQHKKQEDLAKAMYPDKTAFHPIVTPVNTAFRDLEEMQVKLGYLALCREYLA